MIRLTLLPLAVIGTAILCGVAHAAAAELIPVHSTAPADGAVIEAAKGPVEVTLAWTAPRQPVPVRFFVEVVAIENNALHEVFASYLDRPTVTLTLDASNAEYAWRVYTIGRSIADYALSRWERFSVQAAK